MQVEISTIIKFAVKFIIIFAIIAVMAIITPKLANFIDKKFHIKNNTPVDRSNDASKWDVFGPSYPKDVAEQKKKNKKSRHKKDKTEEEDTENKNNSDDSENTEKSKNDGDKGE